MTDNSSDVNDYCSICSGTGLGQYDEASCRFCGGSGVRINETVKREHEEYIAAIKYEEMHYAY